MSNIKWNPEMTKFHSENLFPTGSRVIMSLVDPVIKKDVIKFGKITRVEGKGIDGWPIYTVVLDNDEAKIESAHHRELTLVVAEKVTDTAPKNVFDNGMEFRCNTPVKLHYMLIKDGVEERGSEEFRTGDQIYVSRSNPPNAKCKELYYSVYKTDEPLDEREFYITHSKILKNFT